MLVQADNKVTINGILSEVNIREGTYNKKGKMMPYLGGNIKVRVTQDINKQPTTCEIPVSFFVNKYKNDGGDNPAYESVKALQTDFISIAAGGEERADGISITSASLKENAFASRNGDIISTADISSSFFSKTNRNGMIQQAQFVTTICIVEISEDTDFEGNLTGCLWIKGVVPQWGGRADLLTFKAISKEAVEHIRANWQQGMTVNIAGKINFSTEVVTEKTEMGFGTPIVKTSSHSVKELIITSGSATGLDGDAAYDIDDIRTALEERQVRMNNLKNKPESNASAASAKTDFSKYGF